MKILSKMKKKNIKTTILFKLNNFFVFLLLLSKNTLVCFTINTKDTLRMEKKNENENFE
jgi:hypothetical protein